MGLTSFTLADITNIFVVACTPVLAWVAACTFINLLLANFALPT